jgi:hypothetical protein
MKYAHEIRDGAIKRTHSIILEGIEKECETLNNATKECRQIALKEAICDLMHYADEYDLNCEVAYNDAKKLFDDEVNDMKGMSNESQSTKE